MDENIDYGDVLKRFHKDYNYTSNEFIGNNIPAETIHQYKFRQIGNLLTKWDEMGDNDLIDNAVLQAHSINLPIKGIFLEIVAHVAYLRYHRDEKATGELTKNNKYIHNSAEGLVHRHIHTLKHLGWGFEFSCELVAGWASKKGILNKKASTLKKEHKDWVRNNSDYISQYDECFEFMRGSKSKAYLNKLGYDLNDPSITEQKGTRR